MKQKHTLKAASVTNESEQRSGFIVGSGNSKGGSKAGVNKHNGMVMGGSVTSKRSTVHENSINRLSSNRADGRIV